jgi:hypothetical protein
MLTDEWLKDNKSTTSPFPSKDIAENVASHNGYSAASYMRD